MYKQNAIMPCVQKTKAKAVLVRIYFRFRASLLFIENKITSSRFFIFIFENVKQPPTGVDHKPAEGQRREQVEEAAALRELNRANTRH